METIYVLVCYEKRKSDKAKYKHIIGLYTNKELADKIGKYFCDMKTPSTLKYSSYELIEFLKNTGSEHFTRVYDD